MTDLGEINTFLRGGNPDPKCDATLGNATSTIKPVLSKSGEYCCPGFCKSCGGPGCGTADRNLDHSSFVWYLEQYHSAPDAKGNSKNWGGYILTHLKEYCCGSSMPMEDSPHNSQYGAGYCEVSAPPCKMGTIPPT